MPDDTSPTAGDPPRPRKGWFRIPNEVFACASRIGPHGMLVYVALAHHADRDGRCWPSLSTLENETGLARATIVKETKSLKELGLLRVSRLKRSNLYELVHLAAGPGEPEASRKPLLRQILRQKEGEISSRDEPISSPGEPMVVHGVNQSSSPDELALVHGVNPNQTQYNQTQENQSKISAAANRGEVAAAAAEVFKGKLLRDLRKLVKDLKLKEHFHDTPEELWKWLHSVLLHHGVNQEAASMHLRADPVKALSVTAWFERRKRDQERPIINPVGFLVALLKDPERYGFRFEQGGWFWPED